jgi:branched-chain amino acid transport system substrate-binding protein
MNKRFIVLLSPSLFTLLVLNACTQKPAAFECLDALGCVTIAPDQPVHLAYILALAGETAALGEDAKGGIEIALEDRGGEVLGHPIDLTGEDGGCTKEGGTVAAGKLVEDPSIVGIIGPSCSDEVVGSMTILSDAGLVVISPSSTSPRLTNPEDTWKPGFFRTAHNDKIQGQVAAEFAYNEIGVRTAATIHDGSLYADALQQVFAETFQALGGTITFQGQVTPDQKDMALILETIATDSPEFLYFPIFEPAGPYLVVQTKDSPNLATTILMGADGLLVDPFPENAGAPAIGMYLSGPFVSGPQYDSFLAKWQAKFGTPPPSGFHAHAYDATNLLLDAIAAVATQDADLTLHIGRQALRDYLSTITDFQGLTGELTCTKFGDCSTGKALVIFQITEAEVNEGHWPPPVIWTP